MYRQIAVGSRLWCVFGGGGGIRMTVDYDGLPMWAHLKRTNMFQACVGLVLVQLFLSDKEQCMIGSHTIGRFWEKNRRD